MTPSDAGEGRKRAVAHVYARLPPHLLFGVLRIRLLANGRWQRDDTGPLACVLNVPDALGEPRDLVAWLPEMPGAWWLRTGFAPILGAANAERASWFGTPLLVHATPDRWLAHGGRGVCVLDWSADLRLTLGAIRLVAESVPLARRLDQALDRRAVPVLQPIRTARIAPLRTAPTNRAHHGH